MRIGHVGLILEILEHAGLPPAARSALVEMMSAAAAEGQGIQALDSVLDRLVGWLGSGSEADLIEPAVSPAGRSRCRPLVPPARARRHGQALGARDHRPADREVAPEPFALPQSGRIARQSSTPCPACAAPPTKFWSRLNQEFATLAPLSVAALAELVDQLALARGAKRHASSSTWVSAGESVSIPR